MKAGERLASCGQGPLSQVGDAKGPRGFPTAIQVVNDSAAQVAGISLGCFIVKVNGADCRGRTGHQVHELVRQCPVGHDIHFVIKGRGRVLMTS